MELVIEGVPDIEPEIEPEIEVVPEFGVETPEADRLLEAAELGAEAEGGWVLKAGFVCGTDTVGAVLLAGGGA